MVFAAVNFNTGNGAVNFAGSDAVIVNSAEASVTGYEGGMSVNGQAITNAGRNFMS
jgi:hypothetical protein